jgi:hypothetical protein
MSGVTQMDMYTGNRYFVLKYLKSRFMFTNTCSCNRYQLILHLAWKKWETLRQMVWLYSYKVVYNNMFFDQDTTNKKQLLPCQMQNKLISIAVIFIWFIFYRWLQKNLNTMFYQVTLQTLNSWSLITFYSYHILQKG